MKRFSVLGLALVLSAATAAVAAPTPWVPPSGSQTGFTYANGANDTNLFGSPVAGPGFFAFSPANFTASASNGDSATVSDTARVDLFANVNRQFARIVVSLGGDFALLGQPTSLIAGGMGVEARGTLTVTNIDTMQTVLRVLTFNPAATFTSGSGLFTGEATADLPSGWRNVNVAFNHELEAQSNGGGTSLIQTKTASISAVTSPAVVPLPAAIFAAPLAVPFFVAARKKLLRK